MAGGISPTTAPGNGTRAARAALTSQAVVDAAVQLADRHGLGAVTIRRVAERLGARTMTIYSSVASKDELLALMFDEGVRGLRVEPTEGRSWRETLAVIARQTRATILRHPWLVELSVQHPEIGPNGLRRVEQSLEAVTSAGLDPLTAWRVVSAMDDYTMGFLTREIATRGAIVQAVQAGTTVPDQYPLHLLRQDSLPNITFLVQRGLHISCDHDFEVGLGWLLDGIANAHAPALIEPKQ